MVGPACGRSSNHGGTGGSPIPFVASCRQKSHTVLARAFAHLIGFFDPVVRIPGIHSYMVIRWPRAGIWSWKKCRNAGPYWLDARATDDGRFPENGQYRHGHLNYAA